MTWFLFTLSCLTLNTFLKHFHIRCSPRYFEINLHLLWEPFNSYILHHIYLGSTHSRVIWPSFLLIPYYHPSVLYGQTHSDFVHRPQFYPLSESYIKWYSMVNDCVGWELSEGKSLVCSVLGFGLTQLVFLLEWYITICYFHSIIALSEFLIAVIPKVNS